MVAHANLKSAHDEYILEEESKGITVTDVPADTIDKFHYWLKELATKWPRIDQPETFTSDSQVEVAADAFFNTEFEQMVWNAFVAEKTAEVFIEEIQQIQALQVEFQAYLDYINPSSVSPPLYSQAPPPNNYSGVPDISQTTRNLVDEFIPTSFYFSARNVLNVGGGTAGNWTTIKSGDSGELVAGQRISFRPGFVAESGADFKATLIPGLLNNPVGNNNGGSSFSDNNFPSSKPDRSISFEASIGNGTFGARLSGYGKVDLDNPINPNASADVRVVGRLLGKKIDLARGDAHAFAGVETDVQITTDNNEAKIIFQAKAGAAFDANLYFLGAKFYEYHKGEGGEYSGGAGLNFGSIFAPIENFRTALETNLTVELTNFVNGLGIEGINPEDFLIPDLNVQISKDFFALASSLNQLRALRIDYPELTITLPSQVINLGSPNFVIALIELQPLEFETCLQSSNCLNQMDADVKQQVANLRQQIINIRAATLSLGQLESFLPSLSLIIDINELQFNLRAYESLRVKVPGITVPNLESLILSKRLLVIDQLASTVAELEQAVEQMTQDMAGMNPSADLSQLFEALNNVTNSVKSTRDRYNALVADTNSAAASATQRVLRSYTTFVQYLFEQANSLKTTLNLPLSSTFQTLDFLTIRMEDLAELFDLSALILQGDLSSEVQKLVVDLIKKEFSINQKAVMMETLPSYTNTAPLFKYIFVIPPGIPVSVSLSTAVTSSMSYGVSAEAKFVPPATLSDSPEMTAKITAQAGPVLDAAIDMDAVVGVRGLFGLSAVADLTIASPSLMAEGSLDLVTQKLDLGVYKYQLKHPVGKAYVQAEWIGVEVTFNSHRVCISFPTISAGCSCSWRGCRCWVKTKWRERCVTVQIPEIHFKKERKRMYLYEKGSHTNLHLYKKRSVLLEFAN